MKVRDQKQTCGYYSKEVITFLEFGESSGQRVLDFWGKIQEYIQKKSASWQKDKKVIKDSIQALCLRKLVAVLPKTFIKSMNEV